MNKSTTPRNKMTGFAMRGGLDEPTDTPDCDYWRLGAKRAREKLYELVNDDERLDKFLFGHYWTEENTWMYIYDRTAHMLELVRKLCSTEKK